MKITVNYSNGQLQLTDIKGKRTTLVKLYVEALNSNKDRTFTFNSDNKSWVVNMDQVSVIEVKEDE
jgi:hypothetical protein